MARSENQKLKLFHLIDILHSETDENHSLSMPEIIEKLAAVGIKAERKALYDDIATLSDYGVYIEKTADHRYYIATRKYELAELKILVESVLPEFLLFLHGYPSVSYLHNYHIQHFHLTQSP